MSDDSQAAIEAPQRSRIRKPQPLHAAQISDALLRLTTVEALTGLSRSTIYTLIQRRQFVEPVKLGARCTRFRAGEVQAWLAAQGR